MPITVMQVLRKRRGLTQVELGDIVGLTQSEISLAESGRTVRLLADVADELGVETVDDLLADAFSETGQRVLAGRAS